LTSPRRALADAPTDRLISSSISPPKTLATADGCLLLRTEARRLANDSVSGSAGKMVFRRVARRGGGLRGFADGSIEKRARSCASVSLISAVMSGAFSKALVKILGGGNL
jgi:hypothetical protein